MEITTPTPAEFRDSHPPYPSGSYGPGDWMPQWFPTGSDGRDLGYDPTRLETVVEEGRYFLRSPSSPKAHEDSPRTAKVARSEQLDEIMTVFSLGTTDLARVLRTSRETVYRWRSGGTIRRKEYIARITSIFGLAQRWRCLSKTPIGEALHFQVPEFNRSWLEFLQEAEIQEETAEKLLQRIAEHKRKSWAKSAALIHRAQTDGWEQTPAHLSPEAERPHFKI